MRQVPALSLDADGVGSYVIYGKLKEQGRKWPTGITFQLLGIRPRWGALHHPSDCPEGRCLV